MYEVSLHALELVRDEFLHRALSAVLEMRSHFLLYILLDSQPLEALLF